MSLAIWWIRRDFRLADNPALNAAITEKGKVLPLFIVDPKLVKSSHSGEKRLSFMWAGLKQLDADLHARGSYLTLKEGNPLDVLSQLMAQTDAETIYAEADLSPYAQSRDLRIRKELPLNLISTPSLRHPKDVLKNDGSPYTIFTPYMRAWRNIGFSSFGRLLSAPDRIRTPKFNNDTNLPTGIPFSSTSLLQSGETIAREHLKAFVGGVAPRIFRYNELRDRVDLSGTSHLSPYLRFGMISAREAMYDALESSYQAEDTHAREGVQAWINELIWRDFYISILYHYPHVLERSFRADWMDSTWRNNEQDFFAWCSGQTGYPIIDAAMRQLASTGWMHNRARMIAASFLVKDLLIDWRWGARWFMNHLVDGDPAANNGGWQWAAGTGTDAVPYFRVFNPVLQSQKFDPQGESARRWIPELEIVPHEYIHNPWKMPGDIQKRSGCKIGIEYPHPIVDHRLARERVFEVYRRARAGSPVIPSAK